jgi:cytochrome c
MIATRVRPGIIFLLYLFLSTMGSEATDLEVIKPRVPADQIEEAKTWKNPLGVTQENIKKGKMIFHGKAFCVTCHGKDGKGYDNIPGLVGKLPRNFTDKAWQRVRTDGELLWILKNGSSETSMAPFIPRILTEDEAWYVILYVRSFGGNLPPNK